MATYKKRGGRPKNKAEKISQIEEESTTAEVFSTLDEGASRTEAWVEKNQKAILIFVGVVAISVLGYLGFQNFIQEPKETEAMNEMFQAQSYYEQALTATTKDSLFNLSLRIISKILSKLIYLFVCSECAVSSSSSSTYGCGNEPSNNSRLRLAHKSVESSSLDLYKG